MYNDSDSLPIILQDTPSIEIQDVEYISNIFCKYLLEPESHCVFIFDNKLPQPQSCIYPLESPGLE